MTTRSENSPAGTLPSRNRPLTSVTVPFDVPSMTTWAPAIGRIVRDSTTTPAISRACCSTAASASSTGSRAAAGPVANASDTVAPRMPREGRARIALLHDVGNGCVAAARTDGPGTAVRHSSRQGRVPHRVSGAVYHHVYAHACSGRKTGDYESPRSELTTFLLFLTSGCHDRWSAALLRSRSLPGGSIRPWRIAAPGMRTDPRLWGGGRTRALVPIK